MNFDDIIYVFFLLTSIGIGQYIRHIPDQLQRQYICTGVGVLLVFLVSRLHIIHPLILTCMNSIVVLYGNRKYCHVISFFLCFGHLAFFRWASHFGLPSPPAHTNAVQMIMTLKMVGIAFEIHQSYRFKHKGYPDDNVDFQAEHHTINPSFLDIFQYSFCYAGVLIGPYYKYKTYIDMFSVPYTPYLRCFKILKRRIRFLPVYIGMFLLSDYIFPLEYAASEDILDQPFWYRFFYMTPIFFSFRMRIYTGFVLGECVCIMTGLGAYPAIANPKTGEGPTDLVAFQKFKNNQEAWSETEYNFQAVHNIDEFGSEFLPTIREGIRSWNRTVQYWLVMFVYKQVPFTKPVRMLVTMMVSSFWHGIYPGYYLCLLSAPLFLLAEAEVENLFKKKASPLGKQLFDWIWWIVKMQAFSYMGMAFLLLRIDKTLHYWWSIYFIGHVFVLVIFVGTLLLKHMYNTKLKNS